MSNATQESTFHYLGHNRQTVSLGWLLENKVCLTGNIAGDRQSIAFLGTCTDASASSEIKDLASDIKNAEESIIAINAIISMAFPDHKIN